MRIKLKTLGCRLNEAELETWAGEFQSRGHQLANETEEADLLVFNSCAVTQEAVRKSRHWLRKAARENPRARIVLSGCYATLNREEAASLGVDLIVNNTDKPRLVEIAEQALALPTLPAGSTEPGETALYRLGRHRAFIKVQDGCRYRCTYCIVTVARGDERSRPVEEIIEEIERLHQQGIREVVLTGVHLGGYGNDLGTHLGELLESLLQRTTVPRIRLGSLEPWEIPDRFIDCFADSRLMSHLHLPLQSGSDSVLKRMARRCRSGEFALLVERLRSRVPDINITTDLIVGFPGETDEEWQETLAFVRSVGFGDIHLFGYSPRTGTAAAAMPDHVPGPIRKARIQVISALCEDQRRAFAQRHIGREYPILWEGTRPLDEGRSEITGYTPNYLKVGLVVSAEQAERLSYRIEPARLTGLSADGRLMQSELIG